MDKWSSATSVPYTYVIHRLLYKYTMASLEVVPTIPFVPQVHDANNLSDVITETLANWSVNLVDQVCVSQQTIESKLFMQLQVVLRRWNHLSCFHHNLHLAVTT